MRSHFRVLLPLAQTVFTAAVLISAAAQPRFRAAGHCGFFDPSEFCPPIPVSSLVAHFVESNLPLLPVLAPFYNLLGGPDRPNLPVLVTLLGLAGIGIWFCVGQFLDDVIAAFQNHPIPRRHLYPSIFLSVP